MNQPLPTAVKQPFTYFIKCFTKKYAAFGGRASRSEFWYFTLFHGLSASLLLLLDQLFFPKLDGEQIHVLYTLYLLGSLLPYLAVSVRRLHDTGRSSWWMLLTLTIVGGFALLVFFCLKGDEGENGYGKAPLAAAEPLSNGA